ncbi:MAG: hypothetical protein AAF550_13305, partial [Myxococcota bacterium]
MRNWIWRAGISLWMLSIVPEAHAQRSLQRVLDLNRQAMDAYTNLDLRNAQRLLESALEMSTTEGLSGPPVARTYCNLGVVSIAGFGETAEGVEYFRRALGADPNVQLDPLTSTPDVQTGFQIAVQRGAIGGEAGRPLQTATGNIPHVPVVEQLSQTAVPVFVEAPADAPVGDVYVYYRSTGMREFTRGDMWRMTGGLGFEIPCAEVFAPRVQYYIVAFGNDGSPLGFAGTQESPIEVPIMSTRTQPPAALPGQTPPQPCGEDECPPGMPGCSGGGGADGDLGDTCVADSDCRSGLSCSENFCVAPSYSRDPRYEEEVFFAAPRFFLRLGGAFGFGYARQGMLADSSPAIPDDPTDAWIRGGEPNCRSRGEDTYCVRVESQGLVSAIGIKTAFGYYLHPRFALGTSLRFQPDSGEGTLSNLLIAVRGQVL